MGQMNGGRKVGCGGMEVRKEASGERRCRRSETLQRGIGVNSIRKRVEKRKRVDDVERRMDGVEVKVKVMEGKRREAP